MNDQLPIEEYFRYHPPSPERQLQHDKINQAALALAQAIDVLVQDPSCRQMALANVQQARMFANQGLTVDWLLMARREGGEA